MLALTAIAFATPANAISLEEAVSYALQSNPEIGQSVANREATEFELRQARALYLPRVDLDASSGYQEFDSPSRRLAGIGGQGLEPRDVGVSANWNLFDGFGREAEIEKQASRVDGASYRVYERSELVAYTIAREYFEILLQQRILAISQDNVAFHSNIKSRIDQGVSGGGLTAADQQQADERLKAAEVRVIEARDELDQARIRFFRTVALPPDTLQPYRLLSGSVPGNLEHALNAARENNPGIRIAEADLDAAFASVKGARSRYFPTIGVEASARTGEDLDGVNNRTDDLQVRLVSRWNIFAGGADIAYEQEQVRRAYEQRMALESALRDATEAVSSAWETRRRQSSAYSTLQDQARFGREVVGSYEEQFKAGKRTLLDVLSAQNSYTNARVLAETAMFSRDLADYRILAATGGLVSALGGSYPIQADAYAREQARVPPTAAIEDLRIYPPDRDTGYGWHATVTHYE